MLKRVVVSFRGSATLKDLAIDADGKIIEFDNPINADSKEKLGVHQGFHGKTVQVQCGSIDRVDLTLFPFYDSLFK